MRTWIVPIALIGCAWSAGTARADQCAYLDRSTALRAADEIRRHPTLVELCEPCGDRVPGVPATATSVVVRPVDEGRFFEVAVDGDGIDLAYTFVQSTAERYRNLAAVAGCPATGVSASLRIDQAIPLEPAAVVGPPAVFYVVGSPPSIAPWVISQGPFA
jgi:hypothetical protein